jgi:hypothetical protein
LVAPGSYRVELALRKNGKLQETGLEQDIQVKLLRQNSLATSSPDEVVAFGLRVDELNRQLAGATSAMEALLKEIGAIKQTLPRSAAAVSLRDDARAIELEVQNLQLLLSGHTSRDTMSAQGPVSITGRLQAAQLGTAFATHGPTPTHERSLDIAERQFAGFKARLDQVTNSDLPALREALDQAGVPWTPGRGVPAGD